MATATLVWTKLGAEAQVGGADPADWANDTMMVMLLDTDFDEDVVEFIDDVSATEVTGTNWPAGGVAIPSIAVTSTGSPTAVKIDAADIEVATVTLAGAGATHLAIYKDTGTPATSRIYAKGTITGSFDPDAGEAAIRWHANGMLTA